MREVLFVYFGWEEAGVKFLRNIAVFLFADFFTKRIFNKFNIFYYICFLANQRLERLESLREENKIKIFRGIRL